MHTRLGLIFGALATLLLAHAAGAHPRMIAYGYPNCAACHEIPLGGRGMLTIYGSGVDRAQSYFNDAPEREPAVVSDRKQRLKLRSQTQMYAKAERQFDADTDLARLDVFLRLLWESPFGENPLRLHAELGLSSGRLTRKAGSVFDSRPGRPNLWSSRALLEWRAPQADESILVLEAGLDVLPEGLNILMGSNPARNFDLVYEESLYSQARITLADNKYLALFYVFGKGVDTPDSIQQKGAGVQGEYYMFDGHMALGAQFRGSLVSDSTKLSYGPFFRVGWKERWALLAEVGGIYWSNLPAPEFGLIENDTHEFRSTLSLYYHIREWLVANIGHSTGHNPELDSRRAFQIFGGIGARISPHFSVGIYGRRDSYDDQREPRITLGTNASIKY